MYKEINCIETSLSSNHLTSASAVMNSMKLTLSAVDEIGSLSSYINTLIGSASTTFEKYCATKLKAQAIRGYYDYQCGDTLKLKNKFINSVESLKYRTDPTASWQNIIINGSLSGNVILYDNYIWLYNNSFGSAYFKQGIEIVYNCGFATVPQDLELICIEFVTERFAESGRGDSRQNMKNRNIGGGVGTNDTYERLTAAHKDILDLYVNHKF